MAHGPWKKPLDFDHNPDYIMLKLGLGRVREHCRTPCGRICLSWHLFCCDSFVTSVALVEVRALLNAFQY